MFLKKIKLINFQKHELFEADFEEGVNVIYGESNTGKSCIARAIRWIVFSDIQGDVVRKYGTDKTIVELVLDNNIIIRRIKSKTINSYQIELNGQLKEYNSIGKTIPEDIKNIFGMYPIKIDKEEINFNISNQITMPFLLADKATFRMKLFNKLTGNDILATVNQNINSNILSLNKELKVFKEDYDSNLSQLNQIKEIIKSDEIEFNKLKLIFQNFKERLNKYDKIKLFYSDYVNIQHNIKDLQGLNESIKIINDMHIRHLLLDINKYLKIKNIFFYIKNYEVESIKIKDMSERICILGNITLNNLKYSINKLVNINKKFNELKNIVYNVKQVKSKITEVIDIVQLKEKVLKYFNIKTLFEQYIGNQKYFNEYIKKVIDLTNLIDSLENDYNSKLFSNGTCPICKQNLKKEDL